MKREGPFPRTTNTIGVPSIDEFINKIREAGGAVVVPKAAIPGMGWVAYCHDTEGNFFGVFQPDNAAE